MTPHESATFSSACVAKLRAECGRRRRRYRAACAAAQHAAQEAARAKAEAAEVKRQAEDAAAARIAEAVSAADQRVIRAELRASAMRAGMLDLDGIKLLDVSVVKLNDAGEVVIPEKFFEDARAARPWLFSAARID